MEKTLLLLAFGLILLITSGSDFKADDQTRFCYVYGSIAVVDDPRRAHFSVYVEESEGLADILVWEEEIRLYADRKGIWHFTENPGLADYVIYFEENKYLADFSIYYIDIESFAGCQ
ncbi:MAG: DUF6150 family protein [Cyclobacteriaceae bacterium]